MPDSKVEEFNDPNELKSAKEYLLDRYSYDHRISNDDTDHNGHIWAVNTILKHLEKSTPLKQIIEKALDLGLVRISKCENDDCIDGLVLVDSETGCRVGCTECSCRGFTITEGGKK